MSNERDLPEGVIDADPPGGWESGEVADRETAAANVDAIDSPSLTESGLAPVMDVDVVSEQERIDGILVQTRVDVGTEDAARIAEVLAQRFADAGITVSAEQLADFAEGIAAADSPG